METGLPSRRGAACIRIETEFGNACEENKNDAYVWSRQPTPREDNGKNKQNRILKSQSGLELALFSAIEAGECHHGTTALHVVFHEEPGADALHPYKTLAIFGLLEGRGAVVNESDHALRRRNHRAKDTAVGAACCGICLFTFDAQCSVFAARNRNCSAGMRR